MLRASRVFVKMNEKSILRNVSYELKPREISLIVGPNGSGKSTLLKTIMGLIKPSRGKIILEGRDITSMEPNERFKLGIVLAPERMRIAANLSVEENLGMGEEVDEYIFDIFPELQPLLNKKAKNLSGGERQMVVLARAILSKPRYLLLDEPFQALHPEIRERIIETIKELSKKTAIAVITHDEIEEVLPISKTTCIMVGGEVVFFGDSREAIGIMQKYMFI